MDFITEIINHINSKYKLSEDLLTIIFPNKRAALMLRKEFEKIDGNIWLPQILSIQEAMSMWSGLHLVENIDVVFELIKILNKNKEEIKMNQELTGNSLDTSIAFGYVHT